MDEWTWMKVKKRIRPSYGETPVKTSPDANSQCLSLHHTPSCAPLPCTEPKRTSIFLTLKRGNTVDKANLASMREGNRWLSRFAGDRGLHSNETHRTADGKESSRPQAAGLQGLYPPEWARVCCRNGLQTSLGLKTTTFTSRSHLCIHSRLAHWMFYLLSDTEPRLTEMPSPQILLQLLRHGKGKWQNAHRLRRLPPRGTSVTFLSHFIDLSKSCNKIFGWFLKVGR